MVSTVQGSLVKVSDITERARIFFDDQVAPENEEAIQVLKGEGVARLLEILKSAVEETERVDDEFCSGIFKTLQEETGIKGKQLYMPIRAAVTGQCHGPDLVRTFAPGQGKAANPFGSCIERLYLSDDQPPQRGFAQ